jgi:hypothetical protein
MSNEEIKNIVKCEDTVSDKTKGKAVKGKLPSQDGGDDGGVDPSSTETSETSETSPQATPLPGDTTSQGDTSPVNDNGVNPLERSTPSSASTQDFLTKAYNRNNIDFTGDAEFYESATAAYIPSTECGSNAACNAFYDAEVKRLRDEMKDGLYTTASNAEDICKSDAVAACIEIFKKAISIDSSKEAVKIAKAALADCEAAASADCSAITGDAIRPTGKVKQKCKGGESEAIPSVDLGWDKYHSLEIFKGISGETTYKCQTEPGTPGQLIPLGYGPFCNPSKDGGDGEAHDCYNKLRMECLIAYRKCKVAVGDSFGPVIGQEGVAYDHIFSTIFQFEENRDAEGEELLNSLTERCIPVQACMVLKTNYQPPNEWPSETPSKGTSDGPLKKNLEEKKSEVLSPITCGGSPREANTPDDDAEGTAVKATLPGATGPLGQPIGTIDECLCSDCKLVLNTNTTEVFKKPETDSDTVDNTNSASSSEEELELSDTVPAVYGEATVVGQLVAVDDASVKYCAVTERIFNAKFIVTRNRISRVTAITIDGVDISKDVEFDIAYSKDGRSYVKVNGLSTDVTSTDVYFTVVEDYTLEAQSFIDKASGTYTKTFMSEQFERVYGLTATGNIDVLDMYTLEVLNTYTLSIGQTDPLGIAPTGDIVWSPFGTGTLNVFAAPLNKVFSLDNAIAVTSKKLFFSDDGWIDVREDLPYQYDSVRLTPSDPLVNSWNAHYRVAAPIAAYLVYSDVVERRNEALGDAEPEYVVAVPSHVVDLDFMRKQVRFSTGGNVAPPRSLTSIENVFNTVNERYIVAINVDSPSPEKNVRIWEYQRTYSSNNISLSHVRQKLAPEEGEVDVGSMIVGDSGFSLNGKMYVIPSDRFRRLLVFSRNTNTVKLYPFETKIGYHVKVAGLGNSYDVFDNPPDGKTLQAPMPAGDLTLKLIQDYFTYISETGDVIQIDVLSGEVKTLRTIQEIDAIISQVTIGEDIWYLTDIGSLKRISTYKSNVFDIAEAIKRCIEDAGQTAIVEQSVPSYVHGFVVTDNPDDVFKNLSYMTGVRLHRHEGDGTTVIGTYKQTHLSVSDYPLRAEHEIARSLKVRDNITLNYSDAILHTDKQAFLEGDNEEFTLTTNAEFFDEVPILSTIQKIKSYEANVETTAVPLTTGLYGASDKVILDIESGKIVLQEYVREEFVTLPIVFTSLPPLVRDTSSKRPIVAWGQLPDITGQPLLWFNGDGTVTVRNFKAYRPGTVLFGLRNFDIVKLDGMEKVQGFSDRYTLINAHHGYSGTSAAYTFNDNMEDGIFLILPTVPQLAAYQENVGRFITVKQKGRNVSVPVSTIMQKNLAPPINVRIRDGVVHLQPYTISGTQRFVIVYFYGRKDARAARYVYNAINRHARITKMQDQANKGLAVQRYSLSDNRTLAINPEFLGKPMRNSGSATKIYNSVGVGNPGDVGGKEFTQGDRLPSSFKEKQISDSPFRLKAFPLNRNSKEWDELYEYVHLDGQSNDEKLVSEFVDVILQPRNFSRIHLTQMRDWAGTREANGPSAIVSLDVGNDKEVPETIGDITTFVFSHITPFRYVFEVLLFPEVDRDGGVQPAFLSEFTNRNKKMWYEYGPPLSFNVPLLERFEVLYYLLDQYYLGIPIPDDRAFLLPKYGFSQLFQIEGNDPNGSIIDKFFQETVLKYWHYPVFGRDNKYNMLIAEVERDGSLGHFQIYENVEDLASPCREKQVLDNSSKIEEADGYYVINVAHPQFFGNCITIVKGPVVPLTERVRLQSGQRYTLLSSQRTSLFDGAAYSVLESISDRVTDGAGYIVMSA